MSNVEIRSLIRLPRRRILRGFTVAAAVSTLVVTLVGCVPESARNLNTLPSKAAIAESENTALQPYYSQKLSWKDCGDGFDCTNAAVPLDWANPDSRQVTIPLIRLKAKGNRLGSLLINPGGPGASGIEFARGFAPQGIGAPLRERYDIVGFDPRGVGVSSYQGKTINCGNDAALDRQIYSITSGKRGSDEWLAARTADAKNYAAACSAGSGDLLRYVDTVSAARDLDVLRAALGDLELNYLGFSYGTFLGSIYANLYPAKVGRVVLDGALDPAASSDDLSVKQAVGFEQALRSYVQDCIKRECTNFKGYTVDSAMTEVRKLLDSYDATPVVAEDGRVVGADTLLTGIIYPLYSQQYWPYLDALFTEAQLGGTKTILRYADGYNDRSTDGKYASNKVVANSAINCLDYPNDASRQAMENQKVALVTAAPVVGPYFAYGAIWCSVWPVQSTRTPAPVDAAGAPPIVVIGTTGDPATPYQYAVNLAKELKEGVLLTYEGQGHTAYGRSNSCIADAVETYFLKGEPPAVNTRC